MSAVADLAASEWGQDDWTTREWAVVARATSAQLAATATARERAGDVAPGQLAALADSGLLTLLIPGSLGGGGGDWLDAAWAVTEVTKGDGSAGALLAAHYLAASLPWLVPDGPHHGAGTRAGHIAASARGRWLWTGPLGTSPLGAQLLGTQQLGAHQHGSWAGSGFEASTSADGGAVVTGSQPDGVATPHADVAVLVARRKNRSGLLLAAVPADRAGLAIRSAPERLGLRLAAATAEAAGLRVEPGEILTAAAALPALFEPVASVLRGAVFLGSAWGAFSRARDYTLTRTPRVFARGLRTGDSAASKDIPTLTRAGQIWALLRAGQAALGAAATALDAAWPRRAELTAAEAAALATRTALAASYSQDIAVSTTQSVYDISGTAATANTFGFDRHWRDARALAQHHPLSLARTSAGSAFLAGTAFPDGGTFPDDQLERSE